ncbi:hypothetical protein Sfulv_15740 [Streptomyces fulvorobeus]|uniref:Uncharacterized protein n=1 Tax=Streptomyces fulvorobeus TaxID=284028 RepID=A0A7J0C4A7_9ACTN|nr:hypothetical protein Sfulv_15740 [Streptomyces fulvorobeus]
MAGTGLTGARATRPGLGGGLPKRVNVSDLAPRRCGRRPGVVLAGLHDKAGSVRRWLRAPFGEGFSVPGGGAQEGRGAGAVRVPLLMLRCAPCPGGDERGWGTVHDRMPAARVTGL